MAGTIFQNSNPRKSSICYRCKEIGHYAHDCKNQYRPTNYHGATVPSYQAIQPNSQVLQNLMPHQTYHDSNTSDQTTVKLERIHYTDHLMDPIQSCHVTSTDNPINEDTRDRICEE